ncbi:MAG: FkbM family methyltransferase [Thermodesulfobacteriota bacterium]|nr:FkbM family methyltransferase [Thermodesulfobacteriota bacterium]
MGNKLLGYKGVRAIWIDVGAHLGEKTFQVAKENPSLIVYAFEPNLKVAIQLIGLLPNFVVIPMAVTEKNGFSDLYINAYDAASSILPFNTNGLKHWIGGENLKVENKVFVPTIRLDTFMNLVGISKVDYIKIDAQGADFFVIKSTGDRLKDIQKISLEVQLTPIPLYAGAVSKDEIVDFLKKSGFVLVDCERQNFDQEENMTFMKVPCVKKSFGRDKKMFYSLSSSL